MHDLRLAADKACRTIPADVGRATAEAVNDYREAESAYTFERDRGANTIRITPVVKRWVEERSPPALYNHGFENMCSAGAIYSRVSSNIFGDWNACGKVMGLAPWHSHWNKDGSLPVTTLMSGALFSETELEVEWDRLRMAGKPLAGSKYHLDAGADGPVEGTEEAKQAAALAQSVQLDLEAVALAAVAALKAETGAKNLCFCGGVGLNSVLNGKLTRELGFEQTFVPPYPGDDGIAIGCCAYGLFSEHAKVSAPLWLQPLSPYQGPGYTEDEVLEAIDSARPWVDVEEEGDMDTLLEAAAAAVAGGHVVALWQGRSEAGQRDDDVY